MNTTSEINAATNTNGRPTIQNNTSTVGSPIQQAEIQDTRYKLTSPEADLEARRAMSIFQALIALRDSEGEEALDQKTLASLKKYEEIISIQNENETVPVQTNQDTSLPEAKLPTIKKDYGFHPLFAISRRLKKIGRALARFDVPKKFNVPKLLKEIKEFLGMEDKDMPKNIEVNNEKAAIKEAMLAGYQPSDETLCLITDGPLLLKVLSRTVHPSIYRLVDLLPDTLKNFFTNNLRQLGFLDMNISHEIGHARQVSKIKKLTTYEVGNALLDYVKTLDESVKRIVLEDAIEKGHNFYNPNIDECLVQLFFRYLPPLDTTRANKISDEGLRESTETLINLTEGLIYSTPKLRLTTDGMRKYVANPCEAEARLVAEAFSAKFAIDDVCEMDEVTYRNRGDFTWSLGRMNDLLTEKAIDNVLLKIEELKARKASENEINIEEKKLQKLYKLSNLTVMARDFLAQEKKLKKQENKA